MADLRGIAAAAARRYGINPQIFLRQINQESGFNPRARSSAGAQGIAQFMPATARSAGVNPWNPTSALYGAARMDARNLAKYHNWQDVLSLYNSGRGWSQGRNIAQTRNYVSSILGGRVPSEPTGGATAPSGVAPTAGVIPSAAPDTSGVRATLAQSLIAASQASARGETPDYSSTFALLGQLRNGQQPTRVERSAIASAPHTPGMRGGLRELFYDPLGAYKNDKPIPAIGGHRDHVHIATANAQEMVAAIQTARAMGLRVSENPFVGRVHPVHVKDSNHYRVLGRVNGKLVGGATDVSGSPQRMADYFRWAEKTFR